MKHFLFFVLCFATLSVQAQFNRYFENKTLRLDYYHSGNDTNEVYTLDELIKEPYWGGSHVNLVDTMNYGDYYVKMFNVKNDSLLYSRGYSTLFREWQTTPEAKKENRTFSETVVMPFPKEKVRIELYSRDWNGVFHKKFSCEVDTGRSLIRHDHRLVYPSFDVQVKGDPAQKVDVVILPEGYSSAQMGEFINDCQQFVKDFFTVAPYSNNQDQFNFRAILAPSEQSGADIPPDGIWKNTILNASYYTFDSERYLMTTDNKSVRDLAANAPYDQIYILVNSPKYGGGAIYNDYCVAVNSNKQSAKILIHEFGHGFAGLADEYYNDTTTYGAFYNLKIEPWEPNVTTLKDFGRKWKHLVKKGTPIPTPAVKEYLHTVGAFEGAGYEPKGMYRSSQDCLMKTFDGNTFCPACQEAIQKMIDFYTK